MKPPARTGKFLRIERPAVEKVRQDLARFDATPEEVETEVAEMLARRVRESGADGYVLIDSPATQATG